MSDNVTRPSHYTRWKLEPTTFIIENEVPFCEGNVIKYIMRWRFKNGIEDLQKAKRYIDILIEQAQTGKLDSLTKPNPVEELKKVAEGRSYEIGSGEPIDDKSPLRRHAVPMGPAAICREIEKANREAEKDIPVSPKEDADIVASAPTDFDVVTVPAVVRQGVGKIGWVCKSKVGWCACKAENRNPADCSNFVNYVYPEKK
jgi:hypothetical protein